VLAPSSIWRAVAIYELSKQYPELNHYQHVGVGHASVVLSFRGELRIALLRKAEYQRWSRRVLEAETRVVNELTSQGYDALELRDLKRFIARTA
jgi:hypothetical protein